MLSLEAVESGQVFRKRKRKEKGKRRNIGNLPRRFKTQETMVLAQHKVAVARTGAMDKPAREQPSYTALSHVTFMFINI